MKAKHFKSRHALLMSLTSLMLCVSMLFGATFAWFTDSVTSGVNRIVSGNLDVEITHQTAGMTAAENVSNTTRLFTKSMDNKDLLWEPEVMAYETFTVRNAGTLNLKYELHLNDVGENDLEGHKLADVIKVIVVDSISGRPAASAFATAPTLADFVQSGAFSGSINAGDAAQTKTIVLYWPQSDNDNDYNVNNGQTASDGQKYLWVDLGITLLATQETGEFDSFDALYDAGSTQPSDGWSGVNTASMIKASATNAVAISSENTSTDVNTQHYAAQETTVTDTATNVSATVPASALASYAKTVVENEEAGTTTTTETKLDLKVTPTSASNAVLTAATGNSSTSLYYDIDMTAITTATTTKDGSTVGNPTVTSAAVTSTDALIEVTLPIGENLDLQGIYHKTNALGEGMENKNQDGEYYTYSDGILTLYVKTFSPFSIAYKFAGGLGTEEAPYKLSTVDQWNAIYAETEFKYFELVNDIDFSGKTIQNLRDGNVEYIAKLSLDGNNHSLKNINSYAGENQLFRTIENTTVKNITIDYDVVATTATGFAYDTNGECVFDNVTTTGSITTTGNWACAFVVYPLDSNGSVVYRNCANRTNLTTNYTSNSYVAPFGSHTMAIKSVVLENCANYGTIKGGNASAFIGMTGGNSSRYTVSGLTNYGKIVYSVSGNLFTYENHTLNAQVTAGEGSEVSALPSLGAAIEDGKLVIKNTDENSDYKVTMSISVQAYNYNGSGNWSGAFPRSLVKTYEGTGGDIITDFVQAPVLENSTSRTGYGQNGATVAYHGIFVPEDFERTEANTILSDNNGVLTLNQLNGQSFYYMYDAEWPAWYSLVTTSNGAESGTLKGSITVTFGVEQIEDGVSAANARTTYTFSIADAAQMFSES